MLIIFNLVLIGVAGLIAYWWANQGLFSSLLHMFCVIIAGAIAIAFWEPVTTKYLLRGGFFDAYAWGVSLVVMFVVSLLLLRVAMDKIAPANVNMPHWVNLSFGGVTGAVAGIISVGIFIIGAGHLQSQDTLVGFRGYARNPNEAARVTERNRLWIPFHKITSDFYSWLSVTSLSTSGPLRHYTPELYQQATLLRDSFGKGRKGTFALKPDAATIDRLYYSDEPKGDSYFVTVNFGIEAQDSGEQLTLSASQVRLIGAVTGTATPKTVHPVAWHQYSGFHRFDDVTHYVSSEPGKESSSPVFRFDVEPEFVPAFIQIRNTRYRLPDARPAPAFILAGTSANANQAPPVGGGSIQRALSISQSIRPVSVSTNMLPATIKERDLYLTTGKATFQRGRGFISRQLALKGIYEPAGTRCVRLDVSRGGPADIFRFAEQAGEGARMALVDSRGDNYTPIGYIYAHAGGTEINLAPTTRLPTIDKVPTLPTSGTQQLILLFYITEGVTIRGFRFGDVDVGHAELLIVKKQ